MYQQQHSQQQPSFQGTSFMPEKDMLYTILADLKRTSREYTIAVNEANCEVVRSMFMDLLNSTLTMQGHLYHVMKQNNMYSTPSKALQQEVSKQWTNSQQTEQQTTSFVHSKLGAMQQQGGMAGVQASMMGAGISSQPAQHSQTGGQLPYTESTQQQMQQRYNARAQHDSQQAAQQQRHFL